MPIPEEARAMGAWPAWNGYVLVDEVPGGSWIAHCLDPQGAIFAMVGPKG